MRHSDKHHCRNLAVGCGKPHGDVHDHDNDSRGLDGDFRLSAHEFQHLAVRARLNTAGINEGKAAPVPVAFAVNPVARHAGRIFHNRHALAGQLIEEHRLADVRSTHDCYNRFCHRKLKSGSAEPNRKKVASLSWDKVKEIAEGKMSDLNAFEIEKAMSMVAGTARSMGITIDGEKPF